ncbi:hypothetical protein AGMMS50268_03830 [Spirochaetia bacterium]|nr:hypothetical protein AGMMS50268_03830 [Spirochaetia bacterium]
MTNAQKQFIKDFISHYHVKNISVRPSLACVQICDPRYEDLPTYFAFIEEWVPCIHLARHGADRELENIIMDFPFNSMDEAMKYFEEIFEAKNVTE